MEGGKRKRKGKGVKRELRCVMYLSQLPTRNVILTHHKRLLMKIKENLIPSMLLF